MPVFKEYSEILKPYSGQKPVRLYELVLSYSDTEDLQDISKLFGVVKSEGEIDFIFKDKTNLKRTSVRNLISQMRERKMIEYAQQKSILRDICDCETALLQLDSLTQNLYFANTGWLRNSIMSQVKKLEKESRDRKESCWRDLVDLRKELIEKVKGYRNAVRLEAMIGDENGYR